MSRCLPLAAGALLLGCLPGYAAEDRSAARVLARLASDEFEERERATRALEALGEEVVEPLRKAADSTDPEVRSRVRRLLARLEARSPHSWRFAWALDGAFE